MIDSVKISEIFAECLFSADELHDGKPKDTEAIMVEGINHTFAFHPDRVISNKKEIQLFLNELPGTFSDGWSFLNLCFDKEGNQWTGLQMSSEQLMVLGIAIGSVSFCAPRDLWSALPGGLPYIQVKQEQVTAL